MISLGAPGSDPTRSSCQCPRSPSCAAPVQVNVTRDYDGFRTSYAVLRRCALTVERVLTLKLRELPQETSLGSLAFTRVLTADARRDSPAIDGTAHRGRAAVGGRRGVPVDQRADITGAGDFTPRR